MPTLARTERQALSDLLLEVGPDAPTLCTGWSSHDLVAHLVARESRVDHGPGLVLRRFAGHTDKVRLATRRRPYPELVAKFRAGPPLLSPFHLPGADTALNTIEYVVHHEDVRRGADGWRPRELPVRDAAALWQRLSGGARQFTRRSPVSLRLVWPAVEADGAGQHAEPSVITVTKGDAPVVEVTGDPVEMALFVTGRTGAARVTYAGDDDAVTRLRATRFGI
jgi:uncharacterized protein (TIGR03085 family)